MHDTQSIENPKSKIQNLKILLWDIDGTLLRSTVEGGYKKYFAATMRKVFGSAGTLDELTPSGMTDTQIMYEALRGENYTSERIFAEKPRILEIFKEEMTKVLADKGEPYEILPGVREILRATAEDARFENALLTGNLSVAAEIKLKTVDLWNYFSESPNAFGEVSHNRNDLAIEAGRLFNEKFQYDFLPSQFIVIGDTPNDIACARAFGAKVIAVATGKHETRANLEKHAPDIILDDLSETDKVLEIFAAL